MPERLDMDPDNQSDVTSWYGISCLQTAPPQCIMLCLLPVVFLLISSRCVQFAYTLSYVLQLYVVCTCADSGAQSLSDGRGSLLFFVWQQRQLSPLCYDVIGCWLWNTWGNENLIEPERRAPNFYCISCVAWSPVVFVLSSFICLSPVILVVADPWAKNLCLGSNMVFTFCGYRHLLIFLLLFLFWQRTASLSQLPVEDLKDPLPPQWRCYMSPQGRRYYVNTTSNGKHQWNVTVQETFFS